MITCRQLIQEQQPDRQPAEEIGRQSRSVGTTAIMTRIFRQRMGRAKPTIVPDLSGASRGLERHFPDGKLDEFCPAQSALDGLGSSVAPSRSKLEIPRIVFGRPRLDELRRWPRPPQFAPGKMATVSERAGGRALFPNDLTDPLQSGNGVGGWSDSRCGTCRGHVRRSISTDF
jgi:hypothetical protein